MLSSEPREEQRDSDRGWAVRRSGRVARWVDSPRVWFPARIKSVILSQRFKSKFWEDVGDCKNGRRGAGARGNWRGA